MHDAHGLFDLLACTPHHPIYLTLSLLFRSYLTLVLITMVNLRL